MMDSDQLDLSGLDKAVVLAALYDNARAQGMGWLHYTPNPMSIDEARALLSETTYFDYVNGRVLKVDLSTDRLDTYLYDRDNGPGAAKRVIEGLRTQAA
jgi:hypothetical protein